MCKQNGKCTADGPANVNEAYRLKFLREKVSSVRESKSESNTEVGAQKSSHYFSILHCSFREKGRKWYSLACNWTGISPDLNGAATKVDAVPKSYSSSGK